MTPPKTETKPEKDTPTEAQLAQISTLAEDLGVEAPESETAAQAQEIIEKLQSLSEEPEPEPEPNPDDDAEEAESEEQRAAEEAQARSGAERSEKQTQAMFDRAMKSFHEKLCVVFEVDSLQPASAPGVIGFLLPGFTEQKSHEDFTRCQTCNGFGNVLTGSMKEGDKERPCPDPRCKGRGYWERQHTPPPAPPVTPDLTGPTAYTQPQAPNGGGEWGEAPAWMGDPRLSTQAQP